MRHLLAGFCLLALLCTCGPATPGDTSPDGPITLVRDGLSVTVDPAYGGRITSLKYGDRELLNTVRDSTGFTYGSTAWTSPQSDWGWPPPAVLDSEPYTVTQVKEHSVLVTSALSDEGFELKKRVLLGGDGEMGLTYWLTYRGDSIATVAPWEVTRLPYGGRIEFYADSVRTEMAADVVESQDSFRTIYFDERHTAGAKVFADLDSVPATYYYDGFAFEKHTIVTDVREVPTGQAPLEIYLEPARQFVEFELQGAARILNFGETVALRTKWVIRPSPSR